MSAIVPKSANDKLVFFQDYLKKRPTDNDSPVTVKAKDLDANYARVTLIESPDEVDGKRTYRVRYDEKGTVLEIEPQLPDGERTGDLLRWDGEAWTLLPAPADNTLRVLTIQNGVLAWVATQDC